jgi:hypothetical protein
VYIEHVRKYGKFVFCWRNLPQFCGMHMNDYTKRISVRRTTSRAVHVHCIGYKCQICLVLKEHLLLQKIIIITEICVVFFVHNLKKGLSRAFSTGCVLICRCSEWLFEWLFSRPGFDSRPGHVSPGTSSLAWR